MAKPIKVKVQIIKEVEVDLDRLKEACGEKVRKEMVSTFQAVKHIAATLTN